MSAGGQQKQTILTGSSFFFSFLGLLGALTFFSTLAFCSLKGARSLAKRLGLSSFLGASASAETALEMSVQTLLGKDMTRQAHSHLLFGGLFCSRFCGSLRRGCFRRGGRCLENVKKTDGNKKQSAYLNFDFFWGLL
jgi:hypothetical protein